MTHSPMSQNRVRDALERLLRANQMWFEDQSPDASELGMAMMAAEDALTAPPASDASGAEAHRARVIALARRIEEADGLRDDAFTDVGILELSAALAAAPTAPAQTPSRPVDAGGVEEDDVPLAEQAKHHGRDWKVWWHGSGQRGDHIMEMSQNGFSYGPELAYLGADFHDAAGRLVAAHNEQVRRLREVIARQAAAKTLLQKEVARLAALATQAPDKARAREGLERQAIADAAKGLPYGDAALALQSLDTQPTGTEASRPVGGDEGRLLMQALHASSELVGEVAPTPSQADSTGPAGGDLPGRILWFFQQFRQSEFGDCPEAGAVYAPGNRIDPGSWFDSESAAILAALTPSAPITTPSQADAQTQEGGE